MTVPFWCLVAVVLMPQLIALVGDGFRKQQLGSIDNRHPRQQAAALEGAGARAYAAQQNAWEALPVFLAVVVIAHLAGADPARSAIASLLFVALRVLHAVCYIVGWSTLRSTVWLAAQGCCVWLVWLAWRA